MDLVTRRPARRPAGRPAPEPLLRRLIGGVLRDRREAQHRTLRDVATSARVSVAYLSEIERGRKEASSEVLVAVCAALGMRLVDLVAAAHLQLAGAAPVLELTGVAGARSGPGRPELHVVPDGGRSAGPASAVLRAA